MKPRAIAMRSSKTITGLMTLYHSTDYSMQFSRMRLNEPDCQDSDGVGDVIVIQIPNARPFEIKYPTQDTT